MYVPLFVKNAREHNIFTGEQTQMRQCELQINNHTYIRNHAGATVEHKNSSKRVYKRHRQKHTHTQMCWYIDVGLSLFGLSLSVYLCWCTFGVSALMYRSWCIIVSVLLSWESLCFFDFGVPLLVYVCWCLFVGGSVLVASCCCDVFVSLLVYLRWCLCVGVSVLASLS